MKKLLAVLPLLLVMLSGCGELDSSQLSSKARRAAERYIKSNGGDVFKSRMSISTRKDLNGDGKSDVVVNIKDDPALCTQQGCTILIFENKGSRIKLVSDIRNVHAQLGQRESASDWPDLIVTSKSATGTAKVGSESVQTYRLEFKNGYPKDATQGEPM